MSYGGGPDFSFGTAGYAQSTDSFEPFLSNGSSASVAQADGKLIVVGEEGTAGIGMVSGFNYSFSARRYNLDGTLDSTFDVSAIYNTPSLQYSGIRTEFTPPGYTGATGVALQADGKILVVGDVADGTGGNPAVNVAKLVRLNTDGTLDTTFGTGGVVTLGTNGAVGALLDYASSALQLPGGQIAVAGAIDPTPGHDIPAVAYLNADGSVDNNDGTAGVVALPLPGNAQAFGAILPVINLLDFTAAGPVTLAMQSDGKLIVGADAIPTGPASTTEIVATRIGPTGTIDPSYGTGGQATIAPTSILPSLARLSATALAFQADGKLIIGGLASASTTPNFSQMLAVRFTTDGIIDPSFGVGGANILRAVSLIASGVGALAIQPDGKIVLADSSQADFARLTPDGLPDGTFGAGGTVLVASPQAFPAGQLRPGSVGLSITVGGKILVTLSDGQGGRLRLLGQGAEGDYNNDGISDPAIYLTKLGDFAYRSSGGEADKLISFGPTGTGQSLPAPGAYDGNGEDELGLYLPAQGAFAVMSLTSGTATLTPFGTPGVGKSLPAEGDYDASGKTEYAVYLPAQGVFIYRPTNGPNDVVVPFGTPGAGKSIPAPADYFGTGRTDFAVYLPDRGAFAIRNPATGVDQIIAFGTPGAGRSIPVPGDYDGSGKAELAVYLPAYGALIYRPANGGPDVVENFGTPGDGQTLPAPGDYTGSGKTEVAGYLPSQGSFAFRPANGDKDVVFTFGSVGATIPFNLASATDTATVGSSSSIRTASAFPAEIPLTPDVLDSLAGLPSKKSANRG